MKKYNVSLFFLLTFGLAVAVSLYGWQTAQASPFIWRHVRHTRVCTTSSKDSVRCHVQVVVDDKNAPQANLLPSGYGPIQFRKAYNLSGVASSKQVIAIIDAYDHPNILSDLNTYSRTFGLPQMVNCAVASATATKPCFQKVNQLGGTRYPSANSGWALEIALDVEAAHAACQNCSLLLVEANSNSYNDLMSAVDRAVAMGATVVSNSYGSSEFSGETTFDRHFNHPGVAFLFSSGDSGYGAEYPAASQYVTAVGGTSLYLNSDSSYSSETAWSGSGSGCSLYEPKPAWQTDTSCSKRTVADVSAVADPATGAAVYDSFRYNGKSGWFQVGGTSLAAPLIAATYALAGGVPSNTVGSSLPYIQGTLTTLHDIVVGSNGSCTIPYLCTASIGYDGPTGLGTPNGTGAL